MSEQPMSDVVELNPKPEAPPEEDAFHVRAKASGRKIANALFVGVNAAVDEKTSALTTEVEALKTRIDRLERLLAPRAAESGEP
jgi:hypothetical protein